ncbi:MAG: trigger factor [Anaerolineae bacterium]
MKVTTKRLENCQVELTIEVEPERVEEAMREAARKISQQTNIPGFRRGKAPYHIVVQTFGRQTVLEEALEELGPKVYAQALDDADVDPYGPGKLVDIQWEPAVLTFHVPMPPEIDLGDYRRLRLDVPPVDVADGEVEKELEELRERHAAWVPAEREARKGDQVAFQLGLAGEEEQKSDVVVLGEESGYVPGLVEALEGMRAGESRTVEITFPEDWGVEELAGQTRSATLTVEEVKEKELPALEELPALVGDYPDLESLKAHLREELRKKKEAERDAQLVDKALTILMEQAKISYPDFLLEEEIDEILESHDSALRRQGFTLDDYLRVMRIEREAYRQQQREEAAQRVRRALLLGRLAELEKLDVDEDEIQAEADAQALVFPNPEMMRQLYQTPEMRRYLHNQLLVEKVRQRVLEIVTGRAPELPAEEPQGESSEEAPAAEA